MGAAILRKALPNLSIWRGSELKDSAGAHPGASRGIPAKPGVRSDAAAIGDS